MTFHDLQVTGICVHTCQVAIHRYAKGTWEREDGNKNSGDQCIPVENDVRKHQEKKTSQRPTASKKKNPLLTYLLVSVPSILIFGTPKTWNTYFCEVDKTVASMSWNMYMWHCQTRKVVSNYTGVT